MSERTPLLKTPSESNSSFNQYPGYSDTSFARGSKRRTRNDSIESNESNPVRFTEQDEEWVREQKAFIRRAVSKPNLKQRIAYQCDTGKRGRMWELYDATLSVVFFSLYIWNTQYVLPDHSPIPFPHSLQTADFTLACLILLQFLPHVWLDKEPLEYAASYFSILTWISVFPVMFAYVQTIYDSDMDNTYMGVERYVFIYPLRFVRAHVSVQRLLIPARNSIVNFSTITRKGLKIGVTIIFTFLTVAAWIHIISFKQNTSDLDLSFYDAFWYTVVSSTNGMSTDLIPENNWTRLVILYIMVAGAIFIPTHLSDLLSLIQQKSKYDRSFKCEKSHEHVVVTGDFDSTSLFEFLREFFCQDHGLATMNTEVVILHPEEPPDDIVLLLEDPAFVNRIQYVKGSSAFRRSLVKVKAESACAAFLLSPKFSKNNDEDDAAQIMRALALKKYNKKLSLYVQVHLPENASHFDFLARNVICIDEMTMGLLAQSLVTPGFASLVVLLTTSVTNRVAHELTRNAKKSELGWVTEYLDGLHQEIYAVIFSDAFVGKTFSECSELIYTNMDAVLFSIGIHQTGTKSLAGVSSHIQVFLNPHDYVIQGNEIGFVISDHAEIAAKMARFNNTTNRWFDPYRGMKFIQNSTRNLFHTKSEEECTDRSATAESESSPSFSNERPSFQRTSSFTQVSVEDDEPPGITEEFDGENIIPGQLTSDAMTRSEVLRKNVEKAKACWDKLDSGVQSVKNHVLICNCSDAFPTNLDIFVTVLRERNSVCRHMPVVILSNCMPSDYERHLLEKFENIHFVKGSPLRHRDLYRARVDHAKRCVVLCDAKKCEESRDTADAASLMVALNIESLTTGDCFVLVECMYRETFKMIGESDTVKNKQEDYVQALMRPSFMNGNVFTSSSLDAILCQCFYNRYVPLILKRLIFTHDSDDDNLSPKIDMQRRSDSGIQSGHMFQIDVPPMYVGQKYKNLYTHLVRSHKAIPLGLYRHVIHKGNGMRYIYINPRHDCIVKSDDKIYIISGKEPIFDPDGTAKEQ